MTRQQLGTTTTTWVLAIALTTFWAASAAAQDPCLTPGHTCYSTPSAHVLVQSDVDGAPAFDFDGLLDGQLSDPLPRIAVASVPGAAGYAESSKNHYAVKAFTNGDKRPLGGHRSAAAFAQYIVIPHDAQNRADVTLDLKLKMSATASTGGSGSYGVVVCGIGERGYLTSDASYIHIAQCGVLVPYSYLAGTGGGIWYRTLSKFGQRYYYLEGRGSFVYDDLDTGIHVIPGLPYLITIFSSSTTSLYYGGGGLAAVDPVLEPAAVNPDVTLEFPNLADNPNPQPLLGDLTPEALTAMGLDAQPFVDLGFFDAPPQDPPPSDPPPPSPIKSWCGPGFWLNNAKKFSASAWPVPTSDDYNSTAGQRAACPAASGNPTLLQVLEDPKGYFTAPVQGVGFNCVADQLSAKSGLVGTAANNNAACSLDQSGRLIP